MPFLGLFRSKEEKLAEAIPELYYAVGMATAKTESAVAAMLKEN